MPPRGRPLHEETGSPDRRGAGAATAARRRVAEANRCAPMASERRLPATAGGVRSSRFDFEQFRTGNDHVVVIEGLHFPIARFATWSIANRSGELRAARFRPGHRLTDRIENLDTIGAGVRNNS